MDLKIICDAITENTTLSKILKYEKFHGTILIHVDPDLHEVRVVEFDKVRFEFRKIK